MLRRWCGGVRADLKLRWQAVSRIGEYWAVVILAVSSWILASLHWRKMVCLVCLRSEVGSA